MKFLLYGATGYTGRLILERCLSRGLHPVLGGRGEPVRVLAESHGLEARVADLENAPLLRRSLDGVGAVLHCAGPFSRTSKPMAEALLTMSAATFSLYAPAYQSAGVLVLDEMALPARIQFWMPSGVARALMRTASSR